jgi:hypothetical protein
MSTTKDGTLIYYKNQQRRTYYDKHYEDLHICACSTAAQLDCYGLDAHVTCEQWRLWTGDGEAGKVLRGQAASPIAGRMFRVCGG